MTPTDLLTHDPVIRFEESGRNLAAVTDQPAPSIAGLANGADLDNYISDLEDLAYQIHQYLDLHKCSNADDEKELPAQLQRITSHVKNLAAIYTDTPNEGFNQFIETQRQIKLQLNQYPDVMANLQYKVLKTDQQIRQLSESVTASTAHIDRQIAFDTSLKNEAQRKARRRELMESNNHYIAASIALRAAHDRHESLLIELQLLRNQFSILKLDRQEAIATKQLAAVEAA